MKKPNLPKHVQIQYKEMERLHGRLKCQREATVWPYIIATAAIGIATLLILK